MIEINVAFNCKNVSQDEVIIAIMKAVKGLEKDAWVVVTPADPLTGIQGSATMKSKEEILFPLHGHCPEEPDMVYRHDDVLKAMDDYTNQNVIAVTKYWEDILQKMDIKHSQQADKLQAENAKMRKVLEDIRHTKWFTDLDGFIKNLVTEAQK